MRLRIPKIKESIENSLKVMCQMPRQDLTRISPNISLLSIGIVNTFRWCKNYISLCCHIFCGCVFEAVVPSYSINCFIYITGSWGFVSITLQSMVCANDWLYHGRNVVSPCSIIIMHTDLKALKL